MPGRKLRVVDKVEGQMPVLKPTELPAATGDGPGRFHCGGCEVVLIAGGQVEETFIDCPRCGARNVVVGR